MTKTKTPTPERTPEPRKNTDAVAWEIADATLRLKNLLHSQGITLAAIAFATEYERRMLARLCYSGEMKNFNPPSGGKISLFGVSVIT
jgi:hypothetical protein